MEPPPPGTEDPSPHDELGSRAGPGLDGGESQSQDYRTRPQLMHGILGERPSHPSSAFSMTQLGMGGICRPPGPMHQGSNNRMHPQYSNDMHHRRGHPHDRYSRERPSRREQQQMNGVIVEDPWAEFEQIMREKDLRKELAAAAAAGARTAVDRGRSVSFSPGRSPMSPFVKRDRPVRRSPSPTRLGLDKKRRRSCSRSSSRSGPRRTGESRYDPAPAQYARSTTNSYEPERESRKVSKYDQRRSRRRSHYTDPHRGHGAYRRGRDRELRHSEFDGSVRPAKALPSLLDLDIGNPVELESRKPPVSDPTYNIKGPRTEILLRHRDLKSLSITPEPEQGETKETKMADNLWKPLGAGEVFERSTPPPNSKVGTATPVPLAKRKKKRIVIKLSAAFSKVVAERSSAEPEPEAAGTRGPSPTSVETYEKKKRRRRKSKDSTPALTEKKAKKKKSKKSKKRKNKAYEV